MDARAEEHLRLAGRNARIAHELYATLNAPHAPITAKCYDWVVVIAFYAAVHSVQAYLLNADPQNHDARRNIVAVDAQLRPIRGQYEALYNDSRVARYDLGPRLNSQRASIALGDMHAIASQIRLVI